MYLYKTKQNCTLFLINITIHIDSITSTSYMNKKVGFSSIIMLCNSLSPSQALCLKEVETLL